MDGTRDNGDGTPAKKRSRPPGITNPNPAQGAMELAKAAMQEEENRRLKLEAVGLISDAEDDEDMDAFKSAEEELPSIAVSPSTKDGPGDRPTKGGPGDRLTKGGPADRANKSNGAAPVVRKSMSDLKGKKVNIAGSGPSKSTPQAAKPNTVVTISSESSSSDSDDEIPANIPPAAMKKKGPPGRATLPGRIGPM